MIDKPTFFICLTLAPNCAPHAYIEWMLTVIILQKGKNNLFVKLKRT